MMDPVRAALERPWQVTLLAWTQIVALVLLLISEIAFMVFVLSSKAVGQLGPFYLIMTAVIMLIVVIELNLSRGLLAGRKGPYTYYEVLFWLYLVLVLIPATIIAVVAAGVPAGVIAFAFIASVLAFRAYLLFNSKTKAYFSSQSVAIRQQHRGQQHHGRR